MWRGAGYEGGGGWQAEVGALDRGRTVDGMFDPSGPSTGSPLLRIFNASFRLGQIAGTQVRAYWLALLVMPLILMEGTEWMGTGTRWAYVALITVLLYAVILAHEFGHVVAGWRYGIVTPLITLSPLGGLAHMSAAAPGPRAEIRVALMGPATHLLWLVVFAPLGWWVFVMPGDGWVPAGSRLDFVYTAVSALVQINLALLCFNLLPFFPMDGGRVLRAVLATRMHPNKATLRATTVGFVGAGLFVCAGIAGMVVAGGLFSTLLIVIGISNALACAQERMVARYSPGPYMHAAPTEAWSMDPDAWKRGAAIAAPPRSSRWALWKARRAAARTQRKAQGREQLQEEVDRILDKVRERGMASLTAAEKATLERASNAWRR